MHPHRLKCVINGKHNIVPIQTLVSIVFFFLSFYLCLFKFNFKTKVRKREEIVYEESFFGGEGGYFYHVCYSSFG